MTTLRNRTVCLYADGAQNPFQIERGIARYVSEHARAIHAVAPTLLHSICLNPDLSLTGNLSPLLGTGLLSWGLGSSASRVSTGMPSVYHIMSPFELSTPIDVMWPISARNSRIATVVTLYDLIPMVFADHYLRHPVMRAAYTARLDLIRHIDGVLALSDNTAADAVERLGVHEDRVHVIHAGTSEHFAGMYASREAAWAHLSRHLTAVKPGFLLYVGGADFRKNMEGTIAGFGRMPAELRAEHQLVIVCNLNPGQPEYFRSEAERAGVGRSELVLTGHITDADLGALYHACSLFVFPSFYEGFGLPILEAMSCGAPVAASATTNAPTVLGDLEGTFDPHNPDSIATCLADLLRSPSTLDRMTDRSRRRVGDYTWRKVAEHSIEAYERVIARKSVRPLSRPRIALVTPWPPEPSGIADYNLRLAAELGQRIDVDIIVGRALDEYGVPNEYGVRLIDHREFDRLRSLRQYGQVLYCMGNSPFHGYIYELLKRRRGAVVLHDVQLLTGFYRWYAGVERPDDPERALADRVNGMYGDRLPPDVTESGAMAFRRQAILGIYMTQELQSHAQHCFVHSKFARDVLELDRDPDRRQVPVSVLPFGMPPAGDARRVVSSRRPRVITLGYVHEVKGIAELIEAWRLLAMDMPGARLTIVGRFVALGESERWHRYAREHAPDATIEFTGDVSQERYAELLKTADLAVQLRLASNGEASAAVADCLANGLPTIVTDLGWTGELPSEVVYKVPASAGPQEVKAGMLGLLSDSGKRTAMGRAALAYARDHSFARVADAYLEALHLR